jgi:hypothetical protein
MPAFSHASRNVLNRRTAERFEGETLFARVARAVCEAECLPRKELYEAWETARRVRRVMRGGPIVELAAGHGLLAALLILLDDTSASAVCVDIERPPSQARVLAALEERWPRLHGRVAFAEGRLEDAPIADGALVASVHACGALTDLVLDRALATGSRVAVLPCCHDLETCDTGALGAWMDGPLAVDATRAARLRHAGYTVRTALIPADITPRNRLLMGWPA